MPRKPRVYFPGAYYHVMLRGNGGIPIFHDHGDRDKLLTLIEESIKRFNYRIHAFCFMTNHVHFAMQVCDVPLSKIIQNISFRYTRYFNKKQMKIGHLFQGRYKALLLDDDSYLLQLVRYIHLNPIRAKMAINLFDYRWSSHQVYIGRSKLPWLTTEFVYNLLADNKENAISIYKQFMQKNDTSLRFDVSMQKNFPAICDDSFMQKLEEIQKNERQPIKLTLDELVQLVCNYYDLSIYELHTQSRKRQLAKIRFYIGRIATDMKVSTLTEVANHFHRDITTFSRSLNKFSTKETNEVHDLKCFIQNNTTIQA